ncbi:MAG: hypothetical protein AAB576_03770 [Elusimicrobiota bacterium]
MKERAGLEHGALSQYAATLAAACMAVLGALPPSLCAAPKSPARVTVGAYIQDIQHLDLKSHSYYADLYLWFRWRDAALNPAASFEFLNPYESWGLMRAQDYEKPLLLPNGEYYQVVRAQGWFSRKLPLYDYPLDRQTLVVELEDSGRAAQDLVFIPDRRPIALNPSLQLPGFLIGSPALVVEAYTYPTDFGDPREAPRTVFSRVRVELPIARPMFPYAVKLILPIVCVVFCASLMFLFHPKYVDARVGIGITALLTIVALQITLNEDLPEVSYLVLMDKIYLGAYLFVIAGLAVVVKTTWMIEHGSVPRAIRLDRRSLIALSLLYVGVTGTLLFQVLR